MLKNLYPILLCPLLIKDDYTVFYTPEREIEVTIPMMLSEKLVELCDGTHNIGVLIDYFSGEWTKESLEELFAVLVENQVLLNSRDISSWVWKFTKNPTVWKPELSKQEVNDLILKQQLQETVNQPTCEINIKPTYWTKRLSERCSSRQFGKQKISQESLVRLLWASCGSIDSMLLTTGNEGIYRRTIPSAGALYPLTLHLCLFKKIGNIEKGVYRITLNHPNKVDMTFFHDKLDKVRRCIVDPRMLNNAVGMIVISGCISRSAMKYGNRGILYTVLEAGHSAQNIHLFAQEEQIATVEVGGFLEDRLAEQLNLREGVDPLTVVVFGSYLTKEEKAEMFTSQGNIQLADIVRKTEIISQSIGNYILPFSMVFVESLTPSTGNIWWSCGRSKDKEQAKVKAIAEATEWFVCGHVIESNLVEGSFNDIGDSAVTPQSIISYLPDQFEKIQPFDPNAMYQWFKAKEMFTNTERLVLADLIFFPYFPKYGKRYAFSNSSGVAAHITVEHAIEHAVLENIEREAFMVNWLNFLKRSLIEIESLPRDLRKRIGALKQIGFRVGIIDITLDLTPVVMVVVTRNNPPFLSCSTASGYDIVQILDRAIMEAEASVYCHMKNGSSRVILMPQEVTRTMDHGAFYENVDRIKYAEFLFGDNNQQTTLLDMKSDTTIHSANELYGAIRNSGLTILTVHFTEQAELRYLPYEVVRVLIPGIVPMNFGYGVEPLGLDRVRSLPVKCGLLNKPMDINKLNRFPHPFT